MTENLDRQFWERWEKASEIEQPELLKELVEVLNREGIERVGDVVGTLTVGSREESG
jgi:hypothetical protein